MISLISGTGNIRVVNEKGERVYPATPKKLVRNEEAGCYEMICVASVPQTIRTIGADGKKAEFTQNRRQVFFVPMPTLSVAAPATL